MPSIGEKLLIALHDADDRIDAVLAEWDTLPRAPGATWIPQEIRDAHRARRHQGEAERQAVAFQVWGYFEGPSARGRYDGPERPTAEELAAWTFLTHWRYLRTHRSRRRD
ncbi:MAG TPA: hypothetical protein VGQ26_07195 [Streptosporangiaceae bacterium]|nr:hypothetical protein [Streptosporangiaceae bacterium]